MKIIGLSGGIASGKNEVAKIFSDQGINIFDADQVVHELYSNNLEIIEKVKKIFPNSYQNSMINRKILSDLINQQPNKLPDLEAIIHPKIREQYQDFLAKNHQLNSKLVVINIPLLLEQDFYRYDYLIAIISDEEIRKKRFIQRYQVNNPDKIIDINLLIEKFNYFKNLQIDDQERIKNANFIIENNKDLEILKDQVLTIYKLIIINKQK
jgi:dephospho-CoA kinase